MLDFTRPPAYADFGANLTRLYANAALRTFLAAASQGLVLWSGFLAASQPRPLAGHAATVTPLSRLSDQGPLVDWMQLALSNPWLAATVRTERQAPAPLEEAKRIEAAPTPFSAYRSDSGHAVAQVIMG